jgi:hypothetical protein
VPSHALSSAAGPVTEHSCSERGSSAATENAKDTFVSMTAMITRPMRGLISGYDRGLMSGPPFRCQQTEAMIPYKRSDSTVSLFTRFPDEANNVILLTMGAVVNDHTVRAMVSIVANPGINVSTDILAANRQTFLVGDQRADYFIEKVHVGNIDDRMCSYFDTIMSSLILNFLCHHDDMTCHNSSLHCLHVDVVVCQLSKARSVAITGADHWVSDLPGRGSSDMNTVDFVTMTKTVVDRPLTDDTTKADLDA